MSPIASTFSSQELERYDRQMLLDGWGHTVQAQLKRSTVFVAGAGGLGSPACLYLAAAGIGRLMIADVDRLELSNLNRQLLHNVGRIGWNKARSATETLTSLNPDIQIIPIETRITEENAESLVGQADVLLDCLDNFPTRYALNTVSIQRGRPLVHAAVWGLEGRLTVFEPPKTPCLRCLVAEPPEPSRFPILGTTPGVIGTLQALETIKLLTGLGTPLHNRLLVWDGAAATFRTYPIQRDPACLACRMAWPVMAESTD